MRPFLIMIVFFILGTCYAQESKLRTWTAVNGKEVEAEFVSIFEKQVTLKLESGKTFKVPLDKLSKSDQDFINNKSSKSSLKENIINRRIHISVEDKGTGVFEYGENGILKIYKLEEGGSLDLAETLSYKVDGTKALVIDIDDDSSQGSLDFLSINPSQGGQIIVFDEDDEIRFTGKIVLIETGEKGKFTVKEKSAQKPTILDMLAMIGQPITKSEESFAGRRKGEYQFDGPDEPMTHVEAIYREDHSYSIFYISPNVDEDGKPTGKFDREMTHGIWHKTGGRLYFVDLILGGEATSEKDLFLLDASVIEESINKFVYEIKVNEFPEEKTTEDKINNYKEENINKFKEPEMLKFNSQEALNGFDLFGLYKKMGGKIDARFTGAKKLNGNNASSPAPPSMNVNGIPEMAKELRKKVEERPGTGFYFKDTDTPYSGKWYEIENNGEIYGIATIEDGKFEGPATWYRPNGSVAGVLEFKNGKPVKGSEKYWNDKGEPVESQRQALGNNEEAKRIRNRASIAESINSMKQLTLALFSYARDHDERFPASLEDLIPDYLDDRSDDKSYLSMMCTDGSRKPWHYVAGITTESEADKVILYSPEPIEGKWLVGFVDGSVSTMEEVEFRALVKDSKKKLKYSEVDALLRKRNGSKKDNLEIVKQYLSNGGSINQRNQFGGTLLHVASVNGNKEIVQLLLSKEAKVNVKNNNGLTPLGLALKFKRSEVSKLLREYGAKTGEEIKTE
ncbi:MAG: ankyrin repeat domain-containing protein [Verrucomicrobiota bacterium]|nr:ankyrin repeat domain-containing protein [Verrucomicrobiota bacterium]